MTILYLDSYEPKIYRFATLYLHLDWNNDMYRYNFLFDVSS